MLDLIDNIYGMVGGLVFQQTVDIPVGTNCDPLLTDLFRYLYEADFMKGLLKKNYNFTIALNNILLFTKSKSVKRSMTTIAFPASSIYSYMYENKFH